MKPIELLKNQLREYQKDLQKSFDANMKGQIDNETHLIHKSNLEPKIFEYQKAINLLETWDI